MTDFEKLVRERYTPGESPTYEEQGDFLCLLNGPEQYENEGEMLAYALTHPEISARELSAYWHSITPDGLPPCAVDWDDEDSKEEWLLNLKEDSEE